VEYPIGLMIALGNLPNLLSLFPYFFEFEAAANENSNRKHTSNSRKKEGEPKLMYYMKRGVVIRPITIPIRAETGIATKESTPRKKGTRNTPTSAASRQIFHATLNLIDLVESPQTSPSSETLLLA
jgi:hypothetical protein